MARPIQHNPEEVLEQAMHLFWKKGYELTSIQDIVAVTGLKPGSLYNIYTNKQGLFEAVLDLYSERALDVAKETLLKGEDPLKNIETFLNEVVLSSIIDSKTNGCLMVKTLLVVSHKDESIQIAISKVFEEVESYLTTAIARLKEEGRASVNASDFARLIIISIYGTHVYAKTNKDEIALQKSVQILLEILRR